MELDQDVVFHFNEIQILDNRNLLQIIWFKIEDCNLYGLQHFSNMVTFIFRRDNLLEFSRAISREILDKTGQDPSVSMSIRLRVDTF